MDRFQQGYSNLLRIHKVKWVVPGGEGTEGEGGVTYQVERTSEQRI